MFELMQKQHPDELKVAPALELYYFGFNLTKPPFKNNPKLREALSLAIDRDIIVESITRRGEIPAYSWVPPGIDNYDSLVLPYANLTQSQRNEQAIQLYAEAGYGPDKPLTFEIRYNTLSSHKNIALAIQSMWKETLGVEACLVNEEFKVFISNVQQMEITNVFRLSWTGDYNDPYTFLQLFRGNNSNNLTGYVSIGVDEQLALAETEVNLDVRKGYLAAAEKLALADHPVIPIYYVVSKHMVASDIIGWQANPLNFHYSQHFSRSTD